MKKHVYYIIGICCTIILMGVFATKTYTKQPVFTNEQNPPTEKSMVFVRDGKLYRGAVKNNIPPVRVKGSEKKEYYLRHTLHDKGVQLFVAWPENNHSKGELVLIKDDGDMKVVKTIKKPINTSASLSPDGKYIAFLSGGPEYLGYVLDLEGDVVEELPDHVYGTVAWNNAGTGVAYTKVSIESCGKNGSVNDIMDSDFCIDGLAFYDLESQTETQLTDSGDDYGVVTFSPDDTKLYFQSTRPYAEDNVTHVNSVWFIDLDARGTERLTDKKYSDSVAMMYEPGLNGSDLLWFADNVVYSVSDGKIWKFDFSSEQKASEFIMEGDTLRWKEKGKSIIAHTYRDGRDRWEEIPLE